MKGYKICLLVAVAVMVLVPRVQAQGVTEHPGKAAAQSTDIQKEPPMEKQEKAANIHEPREVTTKSIALPSRATTKRHNPISCLDAGQGRLENGTAGIEFTGVMSAAIADGASPIITVTPLGNCNGLYISSINQKGFTVVENNEGHSSIEFSWIAIAKSPNKLE